MASKKEEKQADVKQRLAAAGAEYSAVKDSLANARTALDPLMIEALKLEVTPGEVEKLSTLSRETVRTIARIAGLGPAPRGGDRRSPQKRPEAPAE